MTRPKSQSGGTSSRVAKREYVPTSDDFPPEFLLRDDHIHITNLAKNRKEPNRIVKGDGASSFAYEWYKTLPEAVRNKVDAADFGDFVKILTPPRGDRCQLHALAERWWDSTNLFHLPFGEMTPLDFQVITGLPFGGDLIQIDSDSYNDPSVVENLIGHRPKIVSGAISHSWIQKEFQRSPPENIDQHTRAFILYILGCSILCTRDDKIHLSFLHVLEDVD